MVYKKIIKSAVCLSSVSCVMGTEVVYPIFQQQQQTPYMQEFVPLTDSFKLAMSSVPVNEQKRVNKETLSNESSEKIFHLDLSEVNFSEDSGKAVLEKLKGIPFVNLRSVDLHNVVGVSELFKTLFSVGSQLYSLTSISATGDKNDIKIEDIECLTKYYEQCPHVLRDLEQYDSRREMSVSFLRVSVDRISDFSNSSYIKGSFVASEKFVYIRSANKFTFLPFSLLVGR